VSSTRNLHRFLGKTVLIQGARIALDAATSVKMDLWIENGLVSSVPVSSKDSAAPRGPSLDLTGHLVLPGLINAHDHLELNLFPRLGRGPYANATAWAEDIYHPRKPPVEQQLRVPKELRLRWGGIKNLLAGVTTVAQHNPPHPACFDDSFPVRVLKRYGWAHSLRFSPDWRSRLAATSPDCPFILHAGEGTDTSARQEITMLASAGALERSTVLVHAVAMSEPDIPLLSRGGSIVWCPTSNLFTLGRTISRAVLNSPAIPIALGTDSAMSADGDLLDELRVAQHTVSAERLYRMVTSVPAAMLKLPTGFGMISNGGPADLLVVRDIDQTPARTLLENNPELVMVGGRIRLLSDRLAQSLGLGHLNSPHSLRVEGRGRYYVSGDIPSLLAATEGVLAGAVRLAGKAVAA
jgi:cytosine/adenosine deaminase-related metal-dependent hydrolase